MKATLLHKLQSAIACAPDQILPFPEFMHKALYDPLEGYYSQSVHIGAQGDFVTSPELGPFLAYALANQFIEVRDALDQNGSILEFGAGTARLAYDLLSCLDAKNCLPERYFILEVSGHLRQLQMQQLQALPQHLYDRVLWCETMPNLKGMVIANEVLDAMPVHKVRYHANSQRDLKWECLGVTFSKAQGFYWAPCSKMPATLRKACEALRPYLQGLAPDTLQYDTEVNLNFEPWLRSVSEHIEKGLVLLIDYGFPRREYYHPSRYQGTLMSHRAQRCHAEVLSNVGEQDITAHVDFTAVAEAALSAEFCVDGYTHQAAFLLSLDSLDKVTTQADRNALKLLTLPHEMGELFKVMGLSRDLSKAWAGFRYCDHRGKL